MGKTHLRGLGLKTGESVKTEQTHTNNKGLGSTDFRLINDMPAGMYGNRWLAVNQVSRKSAVVDLVQPNEDKTQIAICANALRLKHRTRHPALVNVSESGWLKDGSYYQFVDLAPTAVALPKSDLGNGLAMRQFYRCALALLDALEHLHTAELIHCAIHTGCVYELDKRVKLGEMWWAHMVDGRPLAGELAGMLPDKLPLQSLAFAAPEVLNGQPPTRQSDVYAIGAVFYHLLTGKKPRNVPENWRLQMTILDLAEMPITPMRALRPKLDEDLEKAVFSMLQENPQERSNLFAIRDWLANLSGIGTAPEADQVLLEIE